MQIYCEYMFIALFTQEVRYAPNYANFQWKKKQKNHDSVKARLHRAFFFQK